MITNLFLTMFEKSISTGLIILLLLMFSSFLNRRYAAKWKYYSWIALALYLVIPFRIDLSIPKFIINLPEKMTTPIITGNNTPIISGAPNPAAGLAIVDIIAVLWLTGCILFLVVHISSFCYYKMKILKNGIEIKDTYIANQVFELSNELQIKHSLRILQYSGVASPMIIGFFKPILVLPDNDYSVKDLFFILKHELIHLKRHDIFYKLLFVIANAIHWFNPLIYFMQKDAVADIELSCDERVLLGTAYTVRKVYTEALFSTINKQYKKSTYLTTEFYGGKEIMKKRFINILSQTKKKNGLTVFAGIICATLLMGTLCACSDTDSKSQDFTVTTEADTQEDKASTEKDEAKQNVDTTEATTEATANNTTETDSESVSEDSSESDTENKTKETVEVQLIAD